VLAIGHLKKEEKNELFSFLAEAFPASISNKAWRVLKEDTVLISLQIFCNPTPALILSIIYISYLATATGTVSQDIFDLF